VSLNIKNPEACELARLKKVSVTQAVLEAVRDELTREKKRRSRQNLADALIAVGRCCAARMGPGSRPGPAL
jgi:hypothetical protein